MPQPRNPSPSSYSSVPLNNNTQLPSSSSSSSSSSTNGSNSTPYKRWSVKMTNEFSRLLVQYRSQRIDSTNSLTNSGLRGIQNELKHLFPSQFEMNKFDIKKLREKLKQMNNEIMAFKNFLVSEKLVIWSISEGKLYIGSVPKVHELWKKAANSEYPALSWTNIKRYMQGGCHYIYLHSIEFYYEPSGGDLVSLKDLFGNKNLQKAFHPLETPKIIQLIQDLEENDVNSPEGKDIGVHNVSFYDDKDLNNDYKTPSLNLPVHIPQPQTFAQQNPYFYNNHQQSMPQYPGPLPVVILPSVYPNGPYQQTPIVGDVPIQINNPMIYSHNLIPPQFPVTNTNIYSHQNSTTHTNDYHQLIQDPFYKNGDSLGLIENQPVPLIPQNQVPYALRSHQSSGSLQRPTSSLDTFWNTNGGNINNGSWIWNEMGKMDLAGHQTLPTNHSQNITPVLKSVAAIKPAVMKTKIGTEQGYSSTTSESRNNEKTNSNSMDDSNNDKNSTDDRNSTNKKASYQDFSIENHNVCVPSTISNNSKLSSTPSPKNRGRTYYNKETNLVSRDIITTPNPQKSTASVPRLDDISSMNIVAKDGYPEFSNETTSNHSHISSNMAHPGNLTLSSHINPRLLGPSSFEATQSVQTNQLFAVFLEHQRHLEDCNSLFRHLHSLGIINARDFLHLGNIVAKNDAVLYYLINNEVEFEEKVAFLKEYIEKD
ncbi:hypothetical protein DASC09_005660 [Saccharomycopsis crataegensis]|uniref:Uncharacterized protein n=1 Tax=Saccharomycopsis crataegensis TaxID=43959 RepID=A0AAV5QF70_9ASCO|nr:hypothetical protein DASC09_005660 [Saccharomycopsis crataegensis]